MPTWVINLAYLFASALFIFGLKGLTHPRTAVRGNLLGATGMLIAIVVTLADPRLVGLDEPILGFGTILGAMVVGALVGSVLALKIQMTGMPQMVALLNGFGGLASVLVAGAALVEANELSQGLGDYQFLIATAASGLIGSVTFWGSLVAFAKLQEVVVPGQAVVFTG
ncbi:MAG: NAD(P)(+) transhydrogenase (Re/Si-specific) subunit beta, partial [Acidobacteriota bacterium]|nr:NAD(P)(+) transhydrogenase (Re/Si-specific) subunit beta [Acidobacteriota bacterium]